MKVITTFLLIPVTVILQAQNFNGPVGIGTTTPGAGQSIPALLHVYSNVPQQGSSILVENTASFAALIAKGQYEGDMVLQHTQATAGRQAFYYRVRNGNMDVINLSDDLQTINNYISSSRYDGRMSMGFGSDNTTTFPAVLNVGKLSTGSTSAYFEGSVGIGTPTPQFPLHVNHYNNSYGLGMNVTNTSSDPASLSGYAISNSDNGRVGQFVYIHNGYVNQDMKNTVQVSSVGTAGLSFVASADAAATPDIYFQSGDNPHAIHIVGSTGHVGIGTNAPGSYALAVNGDFVARRVRVTQGGGTSWPDYVFEPGYPLQPLDSVEAYIRSYKHLPGIAGASEVGKEGIDVADNGAALLKKIEELTLYIIDLKKIQMDQNKTYQKQIAEMMKKVALLENKMSTK